MVQCITSYAQRQLYLSTLIWCIRPNPGVCLRKLYIQIGRVYYEDSTQLLSLRSFTIVRGCVLIIQCKLANYPAEGDSSQHIATSCCSFPLLLIFPANIRNMFQRNWPSSSVQIGLTRQLLHPVAASLSFLCFLQIYATCFSVTGHLQVYK
jgi:hypothetical protein